MNNVRTDHFLIFWGIWGPKWSVAKASLGMGYNVAEASLGRGADTCERHWLRSLGCEDSGADTCEGTYVVCDPQHIYNYINKYI